MYELLIDELFKKSHMAQQMMQPIVLCNHAKNHGVVLKQTSKNYFLTLIRDILVISFFKIGLCQSS